jgi:plastocyanin
MFFNPRRLLVALFAIALGSFAPAGDIVGRVELTEKGGKKATDLSDVVVYVENSKARARPGREVLTMKSKAFAPHVLAIGTGTTVDFPNEDPILHNVFSVSGEGFDLGLYKRPKSGSRTFDKPGIYTLYCNIHPQMSAIVVIRDNPWYAKTGKDGAFTIEGVPPGKYALTAWHERAQKATTIELTVADKGVAETVLALDGRGFKRQQHKNKFGKDYAEGEKY